MLVIPESGRTHLPDQAEATEATGAAVVNMVLRYQLPLTMTISNEWHRLDGSDFEYNIIGLPGFSEGAMMLPGRDTDFVVSVRSRSSGSVFLRAFKYGDQIVTTDMPMLHDMVDEFEKDLRRQP